MPDDPQPRPLTMKMLLPAAAHPEKQGRKIGMVFALDDNLDQLNLNAVHKSPPEAVSIGPPYKT